ncbi:hypothetical protein HDU76_002931 [Blyttiomyces sp. JEL0837]|nr:hypothetical protein HDU76_002931 [Blyttiomyces sp. JEL0837]
MPGKANDEEPWGKELGHPPSYFDALLDKAEKDAYQKGFWWGLGGVVASGVGVTALKRAGYKIQGTPIGSYHIGLATILSGLLISQLAIHFSFIVDYQLINEQRRREAFWRSEMRRQMGK